MTGMEDAPSCAATGSSSYASLHGGSSTSRLTGRRTAGQLFADLGLGPAVRSERAEPRPGLQDLVRPPEHARPSGVDPGITVSGGIGGIRARLDDLVAVAAMLGAQAEGLAEVAEQAVGMSRDAESWSLLIQDRREVLRADGAAVAAGSYADQAVAAFRARLSATLFVADRCATRASGLARDVEDVVAALDGARKSYEAAEKKAEGLMLSPDSPVLRGQLSSTPGVSFAWGTGVAAMWAWSNGVDALARKLGADTNVRGALPHSQELLGSIVDFYGMGMWGPFAGTDPRGALSRTGLVLAKGLDATGRLRRTAEVTRRPRSALIPPARDLASAAAALHAVSKTSRGAVGVQQVRRPDGTSAWTVFVPGTQAGYLEKASHGRDWASADGVTSGLELAASQAPVAALEAAGARPGDSVSFVGHSQGGAIAKQAAASLAAQGRYRVGSVLNFAATEPANVTADPPGVNVINVYNTADLVPMLDGRVPEAGRDHLNVAVNEADLADEKLRSMSDSQSGRHTMGTYAEAAALLAKSQDPSLRHAAARLSEDLTGGALGPVTGFGALGPTPLRDQLDGGIQIFEVTAR